MQPEAGVTENHFMTNDEPDLPLFIGMSQRAAQRGFELDLLGVTTVLLFPFFPQKLTGLHCILGLNRHVLWAAGNYSYRLLLTDNSQPVHQAWVNQIIKVASSEAGTIMPLKLDRFAMPSAPLEGESTGFHYNVIDSRDECTTIEILPVPAPPLIVWQPCSVSVDVELNGRRYRRGEFICGFIQPPPLTDEERRAIASRPGATSSVTVHIGCEGCSSETIYYSQLNPLDPRPSGLSTSAAPLNEAPVTWSCRCGQNSVVSQFASELLDAFEQKIQTETLPKIQQT
jgi:hypothetical protein